MGGEPSSSSVSWESESVLSVDFEEISLGRAKDGKGDSEGIKWSDCVTEPSAYVVRSAETEAVACSEKIKKLNKQTKTCQTPSRD